MGCHLGKDGTFGDDSEHDTSTPNFMQRRHGADYTGMKLTTFSAASFPPPSECSGTKTLVLRNNLLSDLHDDLCAFSNLQELHLDGNRFVSIPTVVTRKMLRLSVLNISNNPIAHFSGLDTLPNLRSLMISMCGLRFLPIPVLSCPRLETIDASFNEGISFPSDLASTAAGQHLSTISLASCALHGDEFPLPLQKLPRLTSVDVSDNQFNLFRANTFFGELRLVVLKIRKMNLEKIPSTVLSLPFLEELDVAENPQINIDQVWTIPKLRSLCLSHCELTVIPSEFSKLSARLTSLDISHNPNFNSTAILSKLVCLEHLAIVGCVFCSNTDGRDVEWADIAKLRSLRRIDWSDWSQGKAFNPYSTKLPMYLCGMPLENVNGLKLRPGIFTRDYVATLGNLLRDGFFKVDFLFEFGALWHHLGIVKLLKPIGREYFSEACAGAARVSERVKLSVCRYLFFLAFQSHNFDTPIIPPLDVVSVHYAQMTVDPLNYRRDCMRIAGKLLDCNYRMVLCTGTTNEKDMAIHRTTWDMVVDWQSKHTGRSLEWLRYDYCSQGYNEHQGSNPFTVRSVRGSVDEIVTVTRSSELHLDKLVPVEASEYFRTCDVGTYNRSLAEFFRTSEGFIRNEDRFEHQGLELWSRYARFLALHAREKRLAQDVPEKRFANSSTLGSKTSSLDFANTVDSGKGPSDSENMIPLVPPPMGGANSPASASLPPTPIAPPFAVVPTLGMRLVMFLHRSAPLKYEHCLEYLDMDPREDDIQWVQSREHIELTAELWKSTFDEPYLRSDSGNEDNPGSNRSVDVEYNCSAAKKSAHRESRTSSASSKNSMRKVSIIPFDRQDV